MMKQIFKAVLVPTLAVMTSGSALALGLGAATGQAILGVPLRIEIVLIGSEGGIPALDCFSLRPPQAEIAGTYVLRNAQLQVFGEPGRARLLVSSASAVQEPVVEFAVAVGCGFGLSKDYLLLAEEPSRLTAPALPTLQTAATPTESVPAWATPRPSTPPAPPPGEALARVGTAPNLTTLARRNYPLQPKAREKFVRMMLLANPGLKSGETPIDSGTELQVPAGLPLRRQAAQPPGGKPATSASATSRPIATAPQTPAASKPAEIAAKPRQDLLVLGAPAERNRTPGELLAEAERLGTILLEQIQAQDAVAERIGKLDDTLGELKKRYLDLSDRLNRIEAERQAEKLASKPASLDFFELLMAVLAGGLIGALSLYLFNRRQFQRGLGSLPDATSWRPSTADPSPPAPLAKDDFDFSVTTPPIPPDHMERLAQTIKKVAP